MQFSKIRGGGVNNLKNPKNNQNKKISKALAFSLIELSIVLIIIGLLVAGVTGGASLINSAKQRSYINEVKNYSQAVNVFYAVRNRLPGDSDGDGYFGQYSGDSYSGFFPAPYDGSEYSVPNQYSAPFVDLYLENIIDFQPVHKNITVSSPLKETANNGGVPISKVFKDSYFYYIALPKFEKSNSDYYLKNSDRHVIFLNSAVVGKPIEYEFIKGIDNKIDDNNPADGVFRARCTSGKPTDYGELNKGDTCIFNAYILDF